MSSCALALAAGCSSPSPSPPPPPDPRPLRAQSAADLTAVGLGVAIDASDELGAPRLVRAVAPRSALAGSAPDAAARDHVAALAPLWIDHRRAPDLESRGVQRLRGGAALVRLDQQVGGVAIHHGELRVLVHGDGSLAAISGTLRASPGRASFQSTPTAALHRALDALYGAARARPAITEGADRAGYRELAVAGDPEVQVQRARARRELLPDGDRLIAIWSVELFAARPDADGAVAQAARRYLIGDADGRVIRDIDLIASDAFSYRAFADPGGDHDPLDGALASFNPHPTGAPDGTLPPPASASLVAIEAFNAPHDPWLAATATTTSGNNVEAFADIALPLGFSPGDVRPELSAAHTFDQSYDFAAEPLATAAQSSAAAINLFFVTNWLHDWYYDSGFTEATGNAQLDNLGRGGIPGDPLVARAQANAIGGSRDNANIGTPDDGLSPVMNMFLWTGTPSTTLTTPAGTPGSAGFTAGPRAFDVTGGVVLVEDRIGGTHRACGRVTAAAAGKIALFESDGTCATSIAISNASRAGAIGVIAMIATPGAAAHGLPGSALNLPGLVIGFDDGVALEAALPVTATIHRTTSLEHDGDFDNAIVAHEWGHYLHHRLAACEAAQCGAMSEGWGDFTALHMMLRETDARAGTFGVGLYALAAGGIAASGFADPGYFGIRRFPYSTDRAKNALSFRHIGDGAALPGVPTNPGPAGGANSEVHNAGEIWAAMLWEVYNALIDQHGFAEARRRMSDYVVAGLLLTPPDATFTEGRDALIAAAGALDSDDELLMAAAFAGRGAGSCAASPERGSLDFAGVVESGTIAARLATSAISLTDDGASCDHDGYLDPGESGLLRVTVANTGILTAEGVVVSATTTTPGVILGKPIALGDLVARSSVDLAIPVVLAASAPVDAVLDLALHVDGDAGCNTGKLVIARHDRIGVDEQAAIATTDSVETKLVGWTAAGEGGDALWSRAGDATGNHVLLGSEATFETDVQLVSPVLQASATQPLVVTLQHAYKLDATQFPGVFFDGGVIELTDDGGATWRDVRELGADPIYPGIISIDFINALAGRKVFGGTSAAYPQRVPLALDFGTQFAGQPVQLRFRLGTDSCCAPSGPPAPVPSGWQLDDIAITGITNTPFPGFVAEPTKCVAAASGLADSADSAVLAVRRMPRRSLAGVR